LPRQICYHFNKHMKHDRTEDFVQNHLQNSVCFAMEKIDGTNVAVGADGRLFGRRTTIPADADRYSSVEISSLRMLNVVGVMEHVLSVLGLGEKLLMPTIKIDHQAR
jgi:hypothetical protein